MFGVDVHKNKCKGRPKKTWMEEINRILRARGLKDGNWEDKTEWRKK